MVKKFDEEALAAHIAVHEAESHRLDRIEEKLDKLADAMIALARAEEKIATLQEDHQNMYSRINLISTRLDALSAEIKENARTVNLINRITYTTFVAVIGTLIANWLHLF